MKKIDVIVGGAAGDIGRRLTRLLDRAEEFRFFKGVDRTCANDIINDISKLEGGDAIIDFSSPPLALKLVEYARSKKIPIVIGTTGFDDEQKKSVGSAAADIPVLMSPNFARGVDVLYRAAEELRKMLPGAEIEIVELHHNRKKDAPSGTAKRITDILKSNEHVITGRNGICGPRPKDEMGVFSIRGGDTLGEHTVYFFGEGERLELTHRVTDRDTFALGALDALRFLLKKKNGFFTMKDVLQFE